MPTPGWTPQRRMTENETEELKKVKEKRKVKVEMQEDFILLRLLCALSLIPYLMELVGSVGLRPVSVLHQMLVTRQHHLRPQWTYFD